MGDRKHKPTTPTARNNAPRKARNPASGGPGNAAAQAALARQGTRLAPDLKGGITAANAARFGTHNGVKLVDKAAAAATGTDRLLDGTDAAKMMTGANRAVSGGLSAAGHFANDRMVTGNLWGHALASGAKAATDTAISSIAMGGPLASIPGIVDAFVPADSALKPVTATAAAANPFTQMKQGAGAFTDGLTVAGEAAVNGQAGAFRAAQVMEDNAVDGAYGPLPQGLTALVSMFTGDTQLSSKFTGKDAESGKHGVFVQAGNAVGDEAWEVKEAIRRAPETYDRAQQGIWNGAGALIQGTSPAERRRQRTMQELLADRWIE